MIEFRQQIKELVTYILNPEERDEDVIENYTDTVMLACEEYHIKQLKLYGVVFNEVAESKELIDKQPLPLWKEYDKNEITNEVELKCVWCGNEASKDILPKLCNNCFKKGCEAF